MNYVEIMENIRIGPIMFENIDNICDQLRGGYVKVSERCDWRIQMTKINYRNQP